MGFLISEFFLKLLLNRFPDNTLHLPLARKTNSPAPKAHHWLIHCFYVILVKKAVFKKKKKNIFLALAFYGCVCILNWGRLKHFNIIKDDRSFSLHTHFSQ